MEPFAIHLMELMSFLCDTFRLYPLFQNTSTRKWPPRLSDDQTEVRVHGVC